MTRIFKSVISTLVTLSLVAVLPAETTCEAEKAEIAIKQDCDENVFASEEIKKKKKKKKGKKVGKKGKKKKKGFFKGFNKNK